MTFVPHGGGAPADRVWPSDPAAACLSPAERDAVPTPASDATGGGLSLPAAAPPPQLANSDWFADDCNGGSRSSGGGSGSAHVGSRRGGSRDARGSSGIGGSSGENGGGSGGQADFLGRVCAGTHPQANGGGSAQPPGNPASSGQGALRSMRAVLRPLP